MKFESKNILCTLDYWIRTFRLLFNGKSMLLMLHMQCTFPCKTEMRWLTKMVNSKCLAKSSVLTKWHVIQIDIIFTLSLLSLSLHLLLCFRLSYSHWHISSGQQNLLVHFLTSQQASTIVISRNDYTVTNFILLHNALTTPCYNGANMMMAIEKYGSHWKANRIKLCWNNYWRCCATS